MIPLSIPQIQGNEWKYVKDCLDTGWVSSAGNYVTNFEKMTAKYLDAKYAVAVTNGTAALHISLIASNVGKGDKVIVPTLTFVAPVNTVKYCNAEPIFMDCDPQTLCLDTNKLAKFLSTQTQRQKNRIKAIIPVHIFGYPCDMSAIIKLAQKYKLTVIEDATESLGSEYKGKKAGVLGKIGCLSFNGNKIITTGGGGMVITNNKSIAEKIRHLTTQAKKDEFTYNHDAIGYNYRLTNVQAALGVAQLEQLHGFLKIKRKNARLYRKLLYPIKQVEFLWEQSGIKSNFWFYTIKVPKKHHKPLMQHLIKDDIQVRPIWKLIHTLPMYKNAQIFEIKNATKAHCTCINLPCSVVLKESQIKYIVSAIKEYFQKYG